MRSLRCPLNMSRFFYNHKDLNTGTLFLEVCRLKIILISIGVDFFSEVIFCEVGCGANR